MSGTGRQNVMRYVQHLLRLLRAMQGHATFRRGQPVYDAAESRQACFVPETQKGTLDRKTPAWKEKKRQTRKRWEESSSTRLVLLSRYNRVSSVQTGRTISQKFIPPWGVFSFVSQNLVISKCVHTSVKCLLQSPSLSVRMHLSRHDDEDGEWCSIVTPMYSKAD